MVEGSRKGLDSVPLAGTIQWVKKTTTTSKIAVMVRIAVEVLPALGRQNTIPTNTYYLGGLVAGIISLLLGLYVFVLFSMLSGIIVIVGAIIIIYGAILINRENDTKKVATIFLIGSILLIASFISATSPLVLLIGVIGIVLALVLYFQK